MILPELGAYLDGDTSLTIGSTLFLGLIPETPDACVGLYEYAAMQPSETMGTDVPSIEMPRIQATVRGPINDYATARSTADTVWKSLCKVKNQTLSSVNYLRVMPIDSPVFLNRDDLYRPIFVMNFQVWKAVS